MVFRESSLNQSSGNLCQFCKQSWDTADHSGCGPKKVKAKKKVRSSEELSDSNNYYNPKPINEDDSNQVESVGKLLAGLNGKEVETLFIPPIDTDWDPKAYKEIKKNGLADGLSDGEINDQRDDMLWQWVSRYIPSAKREDWFYIDYLQANKLRTSRDLKDEFDINLKQRLIDWIKAHQPDGWDPSNPEYDQGRFFLRPIRKQLGRELCILKEVVYQRVNRGGSSDVALEDISIFTGVNTPADNFGVDFIVTIGDVDVSCDITTRPEKSGKTIVHPTDFEPEQINRKADDIFSVYKEQLRIRKRLMEKSTDSTPVFRSEEERAEAAKSGEGIRERVKRLSQK